MFCPFLNLFPLLHNFLEIKLNITDIMKLLLMNLLVYFLQYIRKHVFMALLIISLELVVTKVLEISLWPCCDHAMSHESWSQSMQHNAIQVGLGFGTLES